MIVVLHKRLKLIWGMMQISKGLETPISFGSRACVLNLCLLSCFMASRWFLCSICGFRCLGSHQRKHVTGSVYLKLSICSDSRVQTTSS